MKQIKLFTTIVLLSLFAMACKDQKTETKATTETEQTADDASEVMAQSYSVLPTESIVNWTGSKPGRDHTGTVNISQGRLIVGNGNVVGGKFTIDMNTITVSDLDGGMKDDLEAHLKGSTEGKEDDFFNVSQHPNAFFKITKVTSVKNDPEASHLVYGDLNIKGIEKNIGFKAQIEMGENSLTVKTPEFKINRTDFGIKFMSKSFFDNLKDKFIEDEFGISINLTAKAN